MATSTSLSLTRLGLASTLLFTSSQVVPAQEPPEFSLHEPSSRQGLIPNVGQFPAYVRWTWSSASVVATATESRLVVHERDAETDAWLPRLSISWTPSGTHPSARWTHPLAGELVYLRSATLVERTFAYGRLDLQTAAGGSGFSARATPGRLDVSIGESLSCRLRTSKTPGVWHDVVGDDLTSSVGSFRVTATRNPDGSESLALARFVDTLSEMRSSAGARPATAPAADATGVTLPGLAWATYLGGSGQDVVREALMAADETIVALGWTESPNYPLTPDAIDDVFEGDVEGLVTRLAADGSQLLSSSFLGGAWYDVIWAGELRNDGRIVITGQTSSAEFPVTPGAFQQTKKGVADAFVTILNAEANAIEASTFVGGEVHGSGVVATEPRTLGLKPGGGVVISGSTTALDYPTIPGALQEVFPASTTAAFVTSLSPDLTHLEYSTFFGGEGSVYVYSLAVSADGEATVVGLCDKDFPITPGTFGKFVNPNTNCSFLARLSADGSRYVYATVLNGLDGTVKLYDVVDVGGGEVVVCGPAVTSDMPVSPDAFGAQPSAGVPCCNPDAFVLRISAGATDVIWGSYLGGIKSEDIHVGLAVGPSGVITMVGLTTSSDFPTTAGSTLPNKPSVYDYYVTRFHPDGKQLSYSTYLGGPGSEGSPFANTQRGPIFLAPDGSVIVSGSAGPGFPTTPGAAFGTNIGAQDGLVARLTMLPVGVERVGAPSPDAHAGPRLSVHHAPFLDTFDFALLVTGAPPDTTGLLALAPSALPSPIAAGGVQLWLPPKSLTLVPWKTDRRGFAQVRLAIPDLPPLIGFGSAAQSFWTNADGWLASDALTIVVGAE